MKTRRLVFALLCLTPLALPAQSESGDEDIVVLSPFSISSDQDSSYGIAASRVASTVVDGSGGTPSVPVTITKKADAVAIQILLSNAGDKQETRNRELYAAVRQIQGEVQKVPTLRLEQREVRFAGGNRKMLSFSRGSTVSHASVVIFAELAPDTRLADRVKQVRDLLDRVTLPGETKLTDGSVGLYLRQPSSFRREILEKVFADLEFVKKGVGSEFEVRPTGLNQQVRLRACSETEVELWIDYSFAIESVRALTNPPGK